jgi:hypothetical protein
LDPMQTITSNSTTNRDGLFKSISSYLIAAAFPAEWSLVERGRQLGRCDANWGQMSGYSKLPEQKSVHLPAGYLYHLLLTNKLRGL